jgi:hypothetical protein
MNSRREDGISEDAAFRRSGHHEERSADLRRRELRAATPAARHARTGAPAGALQGMWRDPASLAAPPLAGRWWTIGLRQKCLEPHGFQMRNQ